MSRRRVLLIGLDSADADLIEGWCTSGHMPHFSALRREGLWSRIGTTAEVMHVSAWPTIYTGTTPGHHGLYHAYQIRGGEQLIHRTEPHRCGRPPFWKFLDDAGRKCIVMDAFMNYPLPGFKGMQILEYGTWTWFGEQGSHPPALLNEIKRRFGRYPAPDHNDVVRVPDQPLRLRDQFMAGAKLKSHIVQTLMREQDWDLLFVSFGEPHGGGHYLWHIGDPGYPSHPGSTEHPMRDIYGAVDEAIGAIAAAADDRTTVIVTSGDGMGPNYSGCHHMPQMLHKLGLFYSGNVGGGLEARSAPKKGLLSALRQAVPLGLRESVTRCLPRNVRTRLGMKWVNADIDWSRSKVFCIPNSNEAYFRVNLQGREPLGIVRSGPEYEDLLGQLREESRRLVNPRNGLQAAERVVLMDETYAGELRKDLPDAVISWSEKARVLEELQSPSAGAIRGPAGYATSPFYTGNHRPNAFVLARGPGVSGKALNGAHIVDIAPTVLTLLGVETPRHFEGRPWNF